MTIAFMLSLIPFFKAVDLELLKTFIALKFVPAILAIMDYVFDAMNIMNLSINAIDHNIDVGSASIGYAMMKIFLSFSAVFLSFKLFRAQGNPFKSAENESWLWKNGGVSKFKLS